MKRPEGFDPPQSQPGKGRSGGQPAPPGRKPVQPARPQKPPRPAAQVQPKPQRVAPRVRAHEPRPDASARAELRRLARDRRRYERAEVRRFTRRARNRRIAIAAVAGVVVTLVGLVFVAVYSPILALRTILVDGTTRVDPALVQDAVDGQLGTPLALIDFDSITQQLSTFPLIRSYVTEIVPPDTLVLHVVERQPVGQLKVGATFRLVDPAGVTIQESAERVPGVPVIDLGGGDAAAPAFAAVVEVLLSLPPAFLAQVDSASARTQDDVSLVLTGVGQGVTWGSADDSARKAALLAALIAVTDPSRPGVFDVSAPTNGIFHPN
jgi:cell division protein FtsQ